MKTYKGNYRCPQCDTYNDTWKLRENTVEKDTVYCWHCGCKVQLNKGTTADGVTRAYEAMSEQIRKQEASERKCGCTGLACIKCNPGPCGHRREG